MAPTVEQILKDYPMNEELVERIAFRKVVPPLEIVPPNPEWPKIFEVFRDRIKAALGDKALVINHAGSTSVPGLPAKAVIDIDLVVPNTLDEPAYIPQLEAAGFDFLIRDAYWHDHRFLCGYEPLPCNLHVFPPDCPEVERHCIFREWLLKCDEDRAAYAAIKTEAAKATREDGGNMFAYNARKNDLIQEVLKRAFKDKGYI